MNQVTKISNRLTILFAVVISMTSLISCGKEGIELIDAACRGSGVCFHGIEATLGVNVGENIINCFCDCTKYKEKRTCGPRCQYAAPKCDPPMKLNVYYCDCYNPSSLSKNASSSPNSISYIRAENRSISGFSYDILIDGEWVFSIAPKGKSEVLKLNSGSHHIEFRISGSTAPACINEEVDLQPGQQKKFVCNT